LISAENPYSSLLLLLIFVSHSRSHESALSLSIRSVLSHSIWCATGEQRSTEGDKKKKQRKGKKKREIKGKRERRRDSRE
jgi:hypothetical protein